jgi:hypothetical protein
MRKVTPLRTGCRPKLGLAHSKASSQVYVFVKIFRVRWLGICLNNAGNHGKEHLVTKANKCGQWREISANVSA